MSDSNYLTRVGYWDMLDVTDESGWAFEILPKEDVVLAGFGAATRAETELDLLPPSERELRELIWPDLGYVTLVQESEEAVKESQDLNAGGMHKVGDEEEEEEEAEEGE